MERLLLFPEAAAESTTFKFYISRSGEGHRIKTGNPKGMYSPSEIAALSERDTVKIEGVAANALWQPARLKGQIRLST